MSSADARPCPYCGELIKVTAIKCRFCGEFLNQSPAHEAPEEEESDRNEIIAWLFPVGNNLWAMLACYLGILALIPFPFLGFILAYTINPTDAAAGRTFVMAGGGICAVVGVAAIIFGVIALLQILQSDQPGLMRSVFGIGAGLIGGVLYPVVFLMWFLPTFLPKAM
ncbi:MAG TPA: zinc ribbon domain-containing protein [Gemmatales bacterium]|nr:zinc ribbon domain-containing protein [Gemmatales bacterium]HMP59357.1 zinc ribbon domain-containing protein [Gemmatales bacterium]